MLAAVIFLTTACKKSAPAPIPTTQQPNPQQAQQVPPPATDPLAGKTGIGATEAQPNVDPLAGKTGTGAVNPAARDNLIPTTHSTGTDDTKKIIPTTTDKQPKAAKKQKPKAEQPLSDPVGSSKYGWVGEEWRKILRTEGTHSKSVSMACKPFARTPAIKACAERLLYAHRSIWQGKRDEGMSWYGKFQSVQQDCPLEAGQLLSVSKEEDPSFRTLIDPPAAPKKKAKRKKHWDGLRHGITHTKKAMQSTLLHF